LQVDVEVDVEAVKEKAVLEDGYSDTPPARATMRARRRDLFFALFGYCVGLGWKPQD
jgi:hypothetical protein